MLNSKCYIVVILAFILFEESYAKGGKGGKLRNRNVLAQNKAHTRNQGDNRILYEGGRAAGYFGTDGVYYGGRNYENAPCVGLCFHNKEKCYSDSQCEEYDRGWPINAREFGPPCVGICQYFRENNMPNPGYPFQHTGEIMTTQSPPPLLPQNNRTCLEILNN